MIQVLDRPTIKAAEININYKEGAAGKNVENSTDFIGKYPYVYIDGVIIEPRFIKTMKIFNNKVLPNILIEFIDTNYVIIDDNFPLDDSVISIFVNANSETLMPIRMDFKVFEFYASKDTRSQESMWFTITGYVNVDEIYNLDFIAKKGTSFDVIRKMSKQYGLGFASNVRSTNDKMTWINYNEFNLKFLNDIIMHSYISDDTFLFGYIDFYYNFNYVDVETALKEDISQQKNVTDNKKFDKDAKPVIIPLTLSNHPDYESTNTFISTYLVDNKSTSTNINNVYNNIINYYSRVDMIYKNYLLDSISDATDDNSIIMKGRGKDEKGLYTDQKNNEWYGKIDSDNMHKNYLYAEMQNKNNLDFLQKLKLVVVLDKPNFTLYRFQKVNVELYNLSKTSDEVPNTNDDLVKKNGDSQYKDKIINKLSGDWLITGINYIFDRKDGNKQEITMIKRELTAEYVFKNKK